MFRCALAFMWLVSTCLCFTSLESFVEPFQQVGLHEAYVSRDNGPVEFNARSAVPPEPLKEKMPLKTIQQSIWIPGYWSWSSDVNDYAWISGVWRIPPPGMEWNTGLWHNLEDEGWIWLNGFWSQEPLAQLSIIADTPPDSITEKPGFPDSSNYFWNPGYWSFNAQTEVFDWMTGAWELLDPNWVLVPPHYEWRLGGYVFIPSYWDWPLERRGIIFIPVLFSKGNRPTEFEPVSHLEDPQIYQLLLMYYPNYLYLCHHIYHYRPEKWASLAPTWWQWHSWWSLPWHNQWGLWWWYTHSGYPAPAGLTSDIAERIRQANPRLLQLMSDAIQPFVVTPRGVVPPQAILSVLNKSKAIPSKVTIMPSNLKTVEKVKEEAEREARALPKSQKLDDDKVQDVEPSRRGKLHGVREVVEQAELVSKPKDQKSVVKLPKKPIFTSGQPQPTVIKGQAGNNNKPSKVEAANPEVQLVPVKILQETRKPANAKPSSKTKHIPPPDSSIIQQVLPGPRVGPPIDLQNETKVQTHPHKDDAPGMKIPAIPPVQSDPEEHQDKPNIPNLR